MQSCLFLQKKNLKNCEQLVCVLPCLVCVQDFQKGLVDVRLTLEAVFDLVDVIDSMVELHRLVVLSRWPTGWRAADWSVGLY